MKIYNVIGKTQSKEFIDEQTKEVLIPSRIIYQLEINQEALNDFDIFGMLRNADERFRELIISLLEMCSFSGDSCFYILDEIAPLFADDFYTKSEKQEIEADA